MKINKTRETLFKKNISFVLFSLLLCLSLNLNASYLKNDTVFKFEDLTDAEITEAVEFEFVSQQGVPADKIDVFTTDGIVKLTGEVNNILAKDRATSIAQMIKGVRGVVNEVKVINKRFDDDSLQSKIENAIQQDPVTESSEFQIAVKNGKVTVKGNVDSWQEKKLATLVIKGVSGVTEVDNRITFDFTSNRTDQEIISEIKKALNWNVMVDDGLIDVNVSNGFVKLSGVVGSAYERSQAVNNAWVDGVGQVNYSDLKVETWRDVKELRKDKFKSRPDDQIKKAVTDAFMYDARVYSFNPKIEVSDGIVTLTGEVDNLRAKSAAESTASNIVGVWKVNNALSIKNQVIENLDETEKKISQAIERDPYLEKYEVNVTIENGVAILTGKVDSYFEKFRAEDVVAKVKGISDIDNILSVEGNSIPVVYDYNSSYYYPYSGTKEYSNILLDADWEIKDNIEYQLWWSPFINLEEVEVTVEDGEATLDGEVDSWKEFYFAEKNAYEGGAIAVNNELKVKYKAYSEFE